MSARQLYSRFAHTCAICGKRNPEATQIWYDKALPRGKRSWCLEHGQHPEGAPQAPQSSAAPQSATPAATGAKPSAWRHHDSAADFVSWQENTPLKREYNQARAQRILTVGEGRGGVNWYGVADVPAVRAAVAEGWIEGVKRLQESLGQLANIPAPRSVKRTRIKSDQGDHLDIHAVYRGALDRAWTRCAKRESFRPRNVRLVADCLDNYSVSAETIFWRGAAVLRLADALTESGYNVEIWAAEAGSRYAAQPVRPNVMLQSVCVKPATAPLDINALATSLCLTGFMRVWGFCGIIHTADEHGADVASNLGSHEDLAPYLPADAQQFVTPTLNSAADARRWIEETIAKLDAAA